MKRTFIAVCVMLAPFFAAEAATRYVTDVVYVTLRAGQGDNTRILRNIKSGTPLQVLEDGDEWVRVKTEDGLDGWIRTRYLEKEPIAADKLDQAVKRVEKLQAENTQMKERLQSLRNELGESEKDRKRLTTDHDKISQNYSRLQEVSAKPAEIEHENQELRRRTSEMDKELQVLRQENEKFKGSATRDWFFAGAGVLLGGVLLGLLSSKMSFRRRSEWV
ncbi:MAG: TIGR04211 family SH3 domain-containing protein [Gammaproteobacteria bacterium]|nr:TIGR04211 family SH3 domain-containing protein [Gammaproteobacteria bacterium]